MNPTTTQEVRALFGRRLEQARRMAGLSLRALAVRIGGAVTYNSLHKYERGEMMPDSEGLRALSKALNQTTEFFFRDFTVSLGDIKFRKKSALGARAEDALRETAADFFERYLEVERALGISTDFEKPAGDYAISDSDDVERAAESLRQAWDLGTDAIGNVVELLEQHQLKVILLSTDPAFDGFSGWSEKIPVIALNSKFPADRIRLTALHELGHLLMTFAENLDRKAIEKMCHRFAGAMLMPRSVFEKELGGHRRAFTLAELVDIKQDYGISIAAIMARAHDLGLLSDANYTAFCILRNKRGWNKYEPGLYAGVEESNRFCQLLQRAVATEALSLNLAASLAKESQAKFNQKVEFVP